MKSPVPIAFRPIPGSGEHGSASDHIVPVHFPDRGFAGARVLPQDAGTAVALEVAGRDRIPGKPGIGGYGPAADQGRPSSAPRPKLGRCSCSAKDVGEDGHDGRGGGKAAVGDLKRVAGAAGPADVVCPEKIAVRIGHHILAYEAACASREIGEEDRCAVVTVRRPDDLIHHPPSGGVER